MNLILRWVAFIVFWNNERDSGVSVQMNVMSSINLFHEPGRMDLVSFSIAVSTSPIYLHVMVQRGCPWLSLLIGGNFGR